MYVLCGCCVNAKWNVVWVLVRICVVVVWVLVGICVGTVWALVTVRNEVAAR